jgi:hypothetical protein
VLVVPSVVARGEGNVLVNPQHADFRKIIAGNRNRWSGMRGDSVGALNPILFSPWGRGLDGRTVEPSPAVSCPHRSARRLAVKLPFAAGS